MPFYDASDDATFPHSSYSEQFVKSKSNQNVIFSSKNNTISNWRNGLFGNPSTQRTHFANFQVLYFDTPDNRKVSQTFSSDSLEFVSGIIQCLILDQHIANKYEDLSYNNNMIRL